MRDLKNITALVKELLEQDERCRNNDGFLYLKVLFECAKEKEINLHSISIPEFLLWYHGKELPIFESVRRARQKIQAAIPELAASEKVEEARLEKESEYRAYAKEAI